MATVERYAIENSVFLASRGIKMLVVACNTASALALPKIREKIGIDVVGVIGPGGRRAVELTKNIANPKVGVIATDATVESRAYLEAVKRVSETTRVFQAGCPMFVPLAEEGWTDEPETNSIAAKYLTDMKIFAPHALVLGCTHYPILRDVIQRTIGDNVMLVDSGEATADEVAQLLKEKGLENPNIHTGERQLCDDLDHFYVTDAAERFSRVAERFLGSKPSKIEAIEVLAIQG